MSSRNVLGFAGGLAAAVLAMHGVATEARAQWTVTILHPPGARASYANAASAGQQAGFFTDVNYDWHACVWHGTAASLVDLNPAGSTGGAANGAGAGRQFGSLILSGVGRVACMWTGSAASFVSLHRGDSIGSEIFGASESQQAGYVYVGFGNGYKTHASMWRGTAGSWIDLHPPGSLFSVAYGVGDSQQVGYATVGLFNLAHASLWSGSAASWVDLHPFGGGDVSSYAFGAGGGQQVGISDASGQSHAVLWTGSAASAVDLHPAVTGATSSSALAVAGGMQVGSAYISGRGHASLWSGTAASWVDLNSFLPPGYTHASATGISIDSGSTIIVGSAQSETTGQYEAVMWKRIDCTPPTITSHPASATACRKFPVGFTVEATGTGPFAFQWRKDGVPLAPTTNPSAATATFQLAHVQITDGGSYDCIVTDSCTSVTSSPAVLTTRYCACVLADIAGGGPDGLEGDGIIDGSDFIAFINSFAAGDVNTDARADVAGGGLVGLDPDGIIDGTDFIIFINVFAAGC